jgi:hypothetical protein
VSVSGSGFWVSEKNQCPHSSKNLNGRSMAGCCRITRTEVAESKRCAIAALLVTELEQRTQHWAKQIISIASLEDLRLL